ncbi:hypothetical protein L249_4061 [Ophiocordyceps polyrhachis-furcata BCC 54312]|uniref:Helicase ATP-binding domain-containing protein n=1 Tax=Ophiocordyceps polyrhachis-furcata BCC 54312 TaxID=1330021 RepID=A0A367L506_9HYPO|nr:hypothetical protein L249_4061 [Ophiocordyceps polyrhachis-furcata BCC 54312]
MLRTALAYVFRPAIIRRPTLALRFQTNPPRLLAPLTTTGCRPTLSSSSSVHDNDKPQLRDYQQECIDTVLSSLQKGHKRVGISLATGSGKTVVFTQLIDKIPSRHNDGDRTLILAHRRELVEQAARHCLRAYPDKTIEIEMGNLHSSGAADITVASVQSITSKGRLDKFDPSAFKLILVDEAHHIVSSGYLKTLEHFGLHLKQEDSPILVGVSATFSRFDGLKLGVAIDEIVFHRDYVDMIGDKWLSDIIFTTVKSSANLSQVKRGAFGDFHTGELSKAVNTNDVNELTVRSWMSKAEDTRQSTLVFCVDLDHVSGLTQAFRRHQIDARFITGDTPKLERSETLDAFKERQFPILVNCGVFTEGTDIPNIDCIVLARPTRSRNLLVQMIGRGMRLYPGKENCHVIDLVSSLETGIITTPTLFGLDPNELVEKASVGDLRDIKERKSAENERNQQAYQADDDGAQATAGSSDPASVTFTDYASVLDLIADTSKEKYVRAISPFAWVRTGEHRHVLSYSDGSFIRIERIEPSEGAEDADDDDDILGGRLPADDAQQQTDDADAASSTEAPTEPSSEKDAPQQQQPKAQYRAIFVRSLKGISKVPYATPREILTASTFPDAVHGADSFASKAFALNFIALNQPWRRLPASEGQLAFLNRVRGPGNELGPEDVSRGRAVDMITKLKHGARGQFSRIDQQRRKRERKAQLAALRQARELVRVGSLQS